MDLAIQDAVHAKQEHALALIEYRDAHAALVDLFRCVEVRNGNLVIRENSPSKYFFAGLALAK